MADPSHHRAPRAGRDPVRPSRHLRPRDSPGRLGAHARRHRTHDAAVDAPRRGAERVIRDAFNRAKQRPRKKLTLVHKNNVLTRAGGLWTRTFYEVAKEFPEVTTDYLHVDAASMFFVTNPERFDVVVTDNLFGDILTDIAAAICGGIGLAASGNINPTGKFPSMFEPVHGSAPDIAGKQLADPTATIMSVAMMLDHLGLSKAAREVEAAVAADLAARGDKKRSTAEVGDALVKALRS